MKIERKIMIIYSKMKLDVYIIYKKLLLKMKFEQKIMIIYSKMKLDVYIKNLISISGAKF